MHTYFDIISKRKQAAKEMRSYLA